MLEGIARVEQDLTDSVELDSVGWFIYTSGLFDDGKLGELLGLVLELFIEHVFNMVDASTNSGYGW